MDIAKIDALIFDLESSDDGSKLLDARVAVALSKRVEPRIGEGSSLTGAFYFKINKDKESLIYDYAQPVTTSIDAAMTTIPDNWFLRAYDHETDTMTLCNTNTGKMVTGCHTSLPIALDIASLEAIKLGHKDVG